MKTIIYRELKASTSSFEPLHEVLGSIGAKMQENMIQVDYIYKATKQGYRLKLRYENNRPQFLYYYEQTNTPTPEVSYDMWNIADESLKDILNTTLELVKVVSKSREVWRKDSFIFHLDNIDNIGNVFEIEATKSNPKELERIKQLFLPYLSNKTVLSNS